MKEKNVFYGAFEQMTLQVAITGSWEILQKYGYKMLLHFSYVSPPVVTTEHWARG